MLHEPAVELGKDHSIPQKTKLGVIMFLAYLIIYAGFVFIGTIFPKALGAKIIGAQNLAFIYGMGLILLAAVMGLIYNYFCTKFENKWNKGV
jgi:uncharacterized membrane protein (DUF485 family)